MSKSGHICYSLQYVSCISGTCMNISRRSTYTLFYFMGRGALQWKLRLLETGVQMRFGGFGEEDWRRTDAGCPSGSAEPGASHWPEGSRLKTGTGRPVLSLPVADGGLIRKLIDTAESAVAAAPDRHG